MMPFVEDVPISYSIIEVQSHDTKNDSLGTEDGINSYCGFIKNH